MTLPIDPEVIKRIGSGVSARNFLASEVIVHFQWAKHLLSSSSSWLYYSTCYLKGEATSAVKLSSFYKQRFMSQTWHIIIQLFLDGFNIVYIQIVGWRLTCWRVFYRNDWFIRQENTIFVDSWFIYLFVVLMQWWINLS